VFLRAEYSQVEAVVCSTTPEEKYNAGLGVYAAKVSLIMGKAAVLAYVAGPTLAKHAGGSLAGKHCRGPPLSRGTVE